MKKTNIDISNLDNIIESTIKAVENGQNEIYNIFEHSKRECERLETELHHLKRMVLQTVEAVDNMTKLERNAKLKLMGVSRDFEKHSEEDIRSAYEYAKDIQIQLSLEQQKEVQLKEKRNDIERSYRSMLKILNQAEGLMYQVGAALGFLKGNLQDVSLQLLDIKEKREFAGKIIRAQEEERKRIAREIHDGPAQTLANIIIRTEISERLLEIDREEAKKELGELKEIVRASLKELRKTIFDLRPSSLDDLGLKALTSRYCEEFEEETGVRTDFKFFGNKLRLSSDAEITLFRIIQESLINVKKHAKAKNVIVKLEFGDERVNLSVTDDGVGFDYDSYKPNLSGEHNFGIMTIKERVSLLGGTEIIESAPNQGTKVFVSIPMDNV